MLKSAGPLGNAKLAERYRRSQILAGLVSLCGFRHADAAEIVGIKLQTMRQKISGSRGVTDEELHALRSAWERIQSGDVEDMPEGAQQVALALRYLAEPPAFDERDLPDPSEDD